MLNPSFSLLVNLMITLMLVKFVAGILFILFGPVFAVALYMGMFIALCESIIYKE